MPQIVTTQAHRYSPPARCIRPLEFTGQYELSLIGLGLPVEAAFEPDAFSKSQVKFEVGNLLRIVGTNGRCWGTVTGVTQHGTLVIEADIAPSLGKARRVA